MDKRRDQRIGKLQNSLEKTYIAEPSIKVIQYGDYHDLLLDKSFKGRNESREDFQEPQFQNNKRFGNIAKRILNKSIEVSPDSKEDSFRLPNKKIETLLRK